MPLRAKIILVVIICFFCAIFSLIIANFGQIIGYIARSDFTPTWDTLSAVIYPDEITIRSATAYKKGILPDERSWSYRWYYIDTNHLRYDSLVKRFKEINLYFETGRFNNMKANYLSQTAGVEDIQKIVPESERKYFTEDCRYLAFDVIDEIWGAKVIIVFSNDEKHAFLTTTKSLWH